MSVKENTVWLQELNETTACSSLTSHISVAWQVQPVAFTDS